MRKYVSEVANMRELVSDTENAIAEFRGRSRRHRQRAGGHRQYRQYRQYRQ